MTHSGRPSAGGDSLPEQLRAERARAARLAAELVVEREKVRQLQDAFNHKDSEAWHQHETIETLKVELRGIATMAAQLQQSILSAPAVPAPASAGALEAGAPVEFDEQRSPAAQEAQMGLKMALMDLEDRLQQAVALVLDELNTRKAAEARIQELEQQLAAVRRRIGHPEG
ncbi:MAG TPA: hypothetical protein VKY74_13045 [Chloroflexia bacterium]|nr:hypothetical protein [Chloroflexia bacterium]